MQTLSWNLKKMISQILWTCTHLKILRKRQRLKSWNHTKDLSSLSFSKVLNGNTFDRARIKIRNKNTLTPQSTIQFTTTSQELRKIRRLMESWSFTLQLTTTQMKISESLQARAMHALRFLLETIISWATGKSLFLKTCKTYKTLQMKTCPKVQLPKTRNLVCQISSLRMTRRSLKFQCQPQSKRLFYR